MAFHKFPDISGCNRILVIGTIAAGKSTLVRRIHQGAPYIPVYSIDNLRHKHNAVTVDGETLSRKEFVGLMKMSHGVYECTGAGPIHADIKEVAAHIPFDIVIRVHTPAHLCLARCNDRVAWPPYPNEKMPDMSMIKGISRQLDKMGFKLQNCAWNDQRLFHIRGWKHDAE